MTTLETIKVKGPQPFAGQKEWRTGRRGVFSRVLCGTVVVDVLWRPFRMHKHIEPILIMMSWWRSALMAAPPWWGMHIVAWGRVEGGGTRRIQEITVTFAWVRCEIKTTLYKSIKKADVKAAINLVISWSVGVRDWGWLCWELKVF